jgi:hypothetical protein
MSIKDHAVLVSLVVRKPQMTTKDAKATRDAESANDAHNAGQYVLIPFQRGNFFNFLHNLPVYFKEAS